MTWNKEEFAAWKAQSEKFFEFLHEWREDLKEGWADREELTDHEQSMAQVFGDIISWEYERDIAPRSDEGNEDEE